MRRDKGMNGQISEAKTKENTKKGDHLVSTNFFGLEEILGKLGTFASSTGI